MTADCSDHPRALDVDSLQANLPTMGLLAAGLSGGRMVVQVNEQTKGVTRPVLVSGRLLLASLDLSEGENSIDRLYCASVAHAVAHLLHSSPGLPAQGLKPMALAVVSAIEDARVEQLLIEQFPGVRRWFLEQLSPQPDLGDYSFEALISRLDRALLDPSYQDDNYWVNKGRDLFAQTRQLHGLLAYSEFRKSASILANDLGQMRVRFDPQHYVVPAPYRDDNSYLWHYSEENPDASEAMSIHQAIAPHPFTTRPEGHDAGQGAEQLLSDDIELGHFLYPEWNHTLELWRRDWCTVIEKLPVWSEASNSIANAAPLHATSPLPLRRIRRISRVHRLRRQWEGDDIDLNAAIEVLVDRRLHLQPEPRLFLRPGYESGASSILVLLDLSESTNDIAAQTSMSLLDLEKKAAVLLADATAHTEDRIAVHGFCSNTRSDISYYRLLEFGASLQDAARARLASVPGRYSTRIGAALRHATTHLRRESTNRRAILLITDGAPSDVDVFMPKYLIEDARAAVQQAHRAGVRTFCIAVDKGADQYVRRIFGWRDYCIVGGGKSLPLQLQKAYARLVAG